MRSDLLHIGPIECNNASKQLHHHRWSVNTIEQALKSTCISSLAVIVGAKVKSKTSPFQRKSRFASKGDEAREVLANTLLNHIPVIRYNFQAKVTSAGMQPTTLAAAAAAACSRDKPRDGYECLLRPDVQGLDLQL